MVLGAACGGTLEDDYRRGRVGDTDTPETPSTGDDGKSGSAHSGTKAAGNIGWMGEPAPEVRQ
jgi:hypothetical protein